MTLANLLNTLMRLLGATNDCHLVDKLYVQASQICKIRKRRVLVAPALLISMHEETGLSLRQLRALMSDDRGPYRPKRQAPGPAAAAIPSRRSPSQGASAQCPYIAA